MVLYHVTSAAAARTIMSEGFRDYRDATQNLSGVWLADRPVDYGVQHGTEAVLRLEVPPHAVEPYEVPTSAIEVLSEGTWVPALHEAPFRVFCVPAALINRYGPPTLE